MQAASIGSFYTILKAGGVKRPPSFAAILKFNQNHDSATGRFTSGGNSDAQQSESSSGTKARGLQNTSGVSRSPNILAASSGANSGSAAIRTAPLEGLPTKVTVPGMGVIDVGPIQKIREVAAAYMEKAGLPYNPPTEYVKVDKARATEIANAYANMAHDPQNPEVAKAYAKMIDEVKGQYDAMLSTGLKVEFIDFQKTGDPYAASPRLAYLDVRDNNHLWVFSTKDGFGTTPMDVKDNPLLAPTDYKISGQTALANDLFRAVHDYYGHFKEGVGFRADGEENAWRIHSSMFSPEARKAMTSETRGQNSWVNFGPYGEANRSATSDTTHFADQKTGLLPEWIVNDGSGVKGTKVDFIGNFRKILKFNPNHDARGRFASASETASIQTRSNVGVQFISPNVQTSTSMSYAKDAIKTPEQALYIDTFNKVDNLLGTSGVHTSVLGAWSDGAENSVMQMTHGIELNKLEVSAAMKGYLAEQKAVVVFRNGDGNAKMHSFSVKNATDPKELSDKLVAAGIPYHTLLPETNGFTVMAFTDNSKSKDGVALSRSITAFANDVDAVHHYMRGIGRFIGSWEESEAGRTEGRAEYDKLITPYLDRHPNLKAGWEALKNTISMRVMKFSSILKGVRYGV